MNNLKPCPKCGTIKSPALFDSTECKDRKHISYQFIVMCDMNNDGCGFASKWYDYSTRAVREWNDRNIFRYVLNYIKYMVLNG